MALSDKVATIFGGTGFVGRHIVRELAKQHITVRVATRTPEKAYFLRPFGHVGQIVPEYCDIHDDADLRRLVETSDYVINCVGILSEKGKATFERMHHHLPERIASMCAAEEVERFVHISALGADNNPSRYARTKKAGEDAVRQYYPKATILRPSVIFGPGDGFFNMFAKMSCYLPALPLIGGGATKFQPVYVDDVADAAIAALTKADVGADSPCGKIYELGGPEIVNFREVYQLLFEHTGRKRFLVPLPFPLAKLQATFLGVLPNPPLTRDQVESLKADNVVKGDLGTLEDLGITPTAMRLVLPEYLRLYKPGGRFADVGRNE
jgi:NADH dehydrogenase